MVSKRENVSTKSNAKPGHIPENWGNWMNIVFKKQPVHCLCRETVSEEGSKINIICHDQWQHIFWKCEFLSSSNKWRPKWAFYAAFRELMMWCACNVCRKLWKWGGIVGYAEMHSEFNIYIGSLFGVFALLFRSLLWYEFESGVLIALSAGSTFTLAFNPLLFTRQSKDLCKESILWALFNPF